jgi:hypothetical protein
MENRFNFLVVWKANRPGQAGMPVLPAYAKLGRNSS